MEEIDKFDKWNEVKKRAHFAKRNVSFKEREIFWTRIGYNIGSEEYGKGNEFQRPVIIIKKISKDLFALTKHLENTLCCIIHQKKEFLT